MIIPRAPGIYWNSYISYMQSPWHVWFIEMGYPELDILRYEDGEWHIFQYYNQPVVPAITKWQTVLGPMRNVPIDFGFCYRFAHALDINRKEFWDRENAKTKAVEEEHEKIEQWAEDAAERATKAIMKSDVLVDRIVKNGMKEILPHNMARHLPKHIWKKPTFKGVRHDG